MTTKPPKGPKTQHGPASNPAARPTTRPAKKQAARSGPPRKPSATPPSTVREGRKSPKAARPSRESRDTNAPPTVAIHEPAPTVVPSSGAPIAPPMPVGKLGDPTVVPRGETSRPEAGPLSRRAAVVAEGTRAAEAVDDPPSERPRPVGKDLPPPAVVAQIRELEAQLDRMIDEASRRDVSALAAEDVLIDSDPAPDSGDLTTLPPPSGDGVRLDGRLPRPDVAAPVADAPPADRDPSGIDARVVAPRPARPVRPEADGLSPARPSGPLPSAPLPSGPLPEFVDPRPSGRDLARSDGTPERAVFDTARELLSSDFYLRKWGRLAMRGRSEEVDDFGFDPIYDQKVRGALEFLYSRYFRVECTGIERIPEVGRCLLVANHSGTLPLDGVMIKTAVKLEHPAGRDVRWLTEDFIYHFPYLGSAMNRLGAVRACQENAERLLAKEKLVAVFPEGVKGIGKLFAQRYRLQRFGRGGFVKLCLRTGTPIIPVAVVGAEETNPMIFRFESISKALGLPYVPVTPTFPVLGPLGLLPAPTKWQIHFGEPIEFGGYGPEAAEDETLVAKLAERVRATIQGMLDKAVGARKSVFFG